MTALAYAGLMALALGVLFLLKSTKHPLDHDPGPAEGQSYPLWDRFSLWHLAGSFLLGVASCMLGVRPVWAITITTLGGVGWELIHGHIDRGDLLWDAIGAVGGVTLCVVLA